MSNITELLIKQESLKNIIGLKRLKWKALLVHQPRKGAVAVRMFNYIDHKTPFKQHVDIMFYIQYHICKSGGEVTFDRVCVDPSYRHVTNSDTRRKIREHILRMMNRNLSTVSELKEALYYLRRKSYERGILKTPNVIIEVSPDFLFQLKAEKEYIDQLPRNSYRDTFEGHNIEVTLNVPRFNIKPE